MTRKKKPELIYKQIENQRKDYQKFYVNKPDPDFNPERNKKIVEDSIKEYDNMRISKHKMFMEKLAERVDAATSYVLYLERGGSSPAEKYFGRRLLAQLRGEKIRRIMRTPLISTFETLDNDNDYIY